jgi:hypothetical protein
LEKMGYLAAAQARCKGLASDETSDSKLRGAAIEKVKSLDDTLGSPRTIRQDTLGGPLYNKLTKKGEYIDGNSPVKGLPGVTKRFIDEQISLGHLQLPDEIKGDIENWLENTSVDKAAAELRKTPKKKACEKFLKAYSKSGPPLA